MEHDICVSGVKLFLPFFPYIIDKAFGVLLGTFLGMWNLVLSVVLYHMHL